VSVERSQSSIDRGNTADYVVHVSTEDGPASDVSVTLTALPSSERATFRSGCAEGNGAASCTIASVTATAPVTLDAQIPVASKAKSVTSVTLTATAAIVTTAKWTPPAAAETVTVGAQSASKTSRKASAKHPAKASAKHSAGSAQADAVLPAGPLPSLNQITTVITGTKKSLVGAGDASGLFPKISPSATPSPAPGSRAPDKPYAPDRQKTHPVSETYNLAAGKSALSAQIVGLIAIAIAVLLVVTRLSVRRRSRPKNQDG
jgi:hypothetical protein